jgi:hypothetical protein
MRPGALFFGSLVDAGSSQAYRRPMEWVGRGVLSVGLVWFVIATFVGGARALLIGTGLFVLGMILSAMG